MIPDVILLNDLKKYFYTSLNKPNVDRNDAMALQNGFDVRCDDRNTGRVGIRHRVHIQLHLVRILYHASFVVADNIRIILLLEVHGPQGE